MAHRARSGRPAISPFPDRIDPTKVSRFLRVADGKDGETSLAPTERIRQK